MAPFEIVRGDGDEFALVCTRSARFGIPGDFLVPQYIIFTVPDPLYVWADGIIVSDRDIFTEILITVDVIEMVLLPEFCLPSIRYKGVKYPPLNLYRRLPVTVNLSQKPSPVCEQNGVYKIHLWSLNKNLVQYIQ